MSICKKPSVAFIVTLLIVAPLNAALGRVVADPRPDFAVALNILELKTWGCRLQSGDAATAVERSQMQAVSTITK